MAPSKLPASALVDPPAYNRLLDAVVQVVTSSTRPTPAEGMVIYETDTDKVLAYSGSAWVAVAYLGQWDTYTPTWTGDGGNPVLGNGSITGRYKLLGKTLELVVVVQPGSTTTFGTSTYRFSIPSGLTFKVSGSCSGFFWDNSASAGFGLTGQFNATGSTIACYVNSTNSVVAPAVPVTWANADFLTLTAVTEIA